MKKIINLFKKRWCLYLGIVLLVIGIIITLIILFSGKKGDNDTEMSYLEKLRYKDRNIYNKNKVKLIEGEFKGIDISSWQGDINFEKVSQSGIDFVMIRCAFRSIESDEIKLDNKFIYNITEAKKYNIPVGIYFYSTAINKKEALEEASYVINLIDDYEIEMPIAYDFEIFNQHRAQGIYMNQINENAIAFMDYVEKHGYQSMLYTNLYAMEHYWNYDNFDHRKIWFAQYINDLDYGKDYFMWQYSSTGRIDGIAGNVDLNESYHMYVKDE